MIRIFRLLSMFLLFTLASTTEAATHISNLIHNVPLAKIKTLGKPTIEATHFRTVAINIQRMRHELKGVARFGRTQSGSDILLDLPLPDGSMHRYHVLANNTMHPDLAAKFPDIRTYNGYGVGKSKEYVKFDITPLGFHAMILSPGKSTVFINPYVSGNTEYYMVYKRSDYRTSQRFHCGVSSPPSTFNYFNKHSSLTNFSTCFLRTYRLAVAATPNYTALSGGIMQALANQITVINQVNGEYETDNGVTLQMVSNNADVIFTAVYPPGVQPYSSGNPGTMLGENIYNLDYVIGSSNYDIGHVFDTNYLQGVAYLGATCNNSIKGGGVSSAGPPLSSPYYFFVVGHEMGHQFNANHVQNNACNRNPTTAVEPGSGSTQMSYAGICAPNVQAVGDAYFNGISLQEIGTFVTFGGGSSCGMQTVIPAAPVVTLPANISIPISTPFALTGIAAGAGSTDFTYTWEQQDNSVSTQPPVPTSTIGPNFRSITPTLDSTRYLPGLASLASNGPFTWEVLPSVSRTMNFRVSVRGNTAGGSCNAYQDMTVTSVAAAGPFTVTYPTAAGIDWPASSTQTVTWTVANTTSAPISAVLVDIFLSQDGGLTFPVTLAAGVANSGSYLLTVPVTVTSVGRIMVRASSGNFFAVSANNFTISGAAPFNPPTLIDAMRDPATPTTAYLNYSSLGVPQAPTFQIAGAPGAIITLDAGNNRFIVTNTPTTEQINNVTVIGTNGVYSAASNAVNIPAAYGAPVITSAVRNPLNTTQAFAFYSTAGVPEAPAFLLNGVPGATIVNDAGNNRFIISNITSASTYVNVRVIGSDVPGNGQFPSNAFIIPGVLTAPVLTVADRNPFLGTQAFIYYSSISDTPAQGYVVNGIPGATVSIDTSHGRFVVSNIPTPRQINNVTIAASDGFGLYTSNAVTIPNIL